jgi:hypothetical protein
MKKRIKEPKMYGGRKKLDKESRETTRKTKGRGKKKR